MPKHDRSNDPFLNHRPSHLQRFSGANSENNMTSRHDDALRARDAQARQEKLYPSTDKMREFTGPKPSPESTMMNRHADERGELNKKQHGESQQLLNRQNSERGRHLQKSVPLPAGFQERTEKEYAELHAAHQHQRDAMERRHLQERVRLREVQ
jgi:hypothetical protein